MWRASRVDKQRRVDAPGSGRTERSQFGQKTDTRQAVSGFRLRRIQSALSPKGREAVETGQELTVDTREVIGYWTFLSSSSLRP